MAKYKDLRALHRTLSGPDAPKIRTRAGLERALSEYAATLAKPAAPAAAPKPKPAAAPAKRSRLHRGTRANG